MERCKRVSCTLDGRSRLSSSAATPAAVSMPRGSSATGGAELLIPRGGGGWGCGLDWDCGLC